MQLSNVNQAIKWLFYYYWQCKLKKKTKKLIYQHFFKAFGWYLLLPLLKVLRYHRLYSAIKLGKRINVNTKSGLSLFKMMHFKLFYLSFYSTLSLICLQNKCKCFYSYPKIISNMTSIALPIAYILHRVFWLFFYINYIWCHHSSLAHAVSLAFFSLLQY